MGVILSAQNIGKAFGERSVLAGISFSINEGGKAALIGANGAGKTTLLRIISGEDKEHTGDLFISRQAKIAVMRQHAEFSSEKTALEEVMECFSQLEADEKRLEELAETMAGNESAIKKYNELQERYIANGGLTFRARAKSTLIGLGLTEDEINLPLAAISGGQRTRALLAKLLLGETEILLLDEPTNHLDLDATVWLEEFLRTCKKTVLVVSHDRYFLDRVTNKTLLLSGGSMRSYSGGYSVSLRQREAEEEAARREREKKQKEISRLEGIITQQKQWNREKNLVTARSKQKAIDRIAATLTDEPYYEQGISFSFPRAEECANEVLTAENISKRFDDTTLISGADLQILRGERVFLLGPNGAGKTTMLRLLLGKLRPDSGSVRFGNRVTVGYYEQALSTLDPQKTVLDSVYDAMPHLSLGEIRNALAAFLFRSDDVYKKTEVLSGGEKARVCLCTLMLGGYNLLLLDEPTNHLDIASREALEGALQEYEGTLLVVSHDRYFIQKLSSRIVEISNAALRSYPFGYDQYINSKSEKKNAAHNEAPKVKPTNDYQRRKEEAAALRKCRSLIERTERAIAEAEEKRASLEAQLTEKATDYEAILELTNQSAQLEKDIEALYETWEKTSAELEERESAAED